MPLSPISPVFQMLSTISNKNKAILSPEKVSLEPYKHYSPKGLLKEILTLFGIKSKRMDP